MEIGFHIPDFYTHFRLNNILLDTVDAHPEYFHDGLMIRSIFGTFPGAVWNGGRFCGGTETIENIKKIIKLFNDKNIPLRFTFTNPLITKEHLGDSYCNQIMRAANNGFNEVIVMSEELEEYIRKNYPDYPVTSSTCKQIETMEGVQDELRTDYKYVVLDYNWNNKFDELEKISLADRDRCEILINPVCIANCPRRGAHYRYIGEGQIKEWEYKKNLLSKQPFQFKEWDCEYRSGGIYGITDRGNFISAESIIEKYAPMGFKHFKIEGRHSPDVNILETYVYYMVKPEYRTKARFEMLSTLTEKVKYFMQH